MSRPKKIQTESTVRKMPDPSPLMKWKPTKDDIIVEPDNGNMIFHFEYNMPEPNTLGKYDIFIIKKKAYCNFLDTLCRYFNFFIKFYDPEEEFRMAYLRIKYTIDKLKLFDLDKFDGDADAATDALITFIYDTIFTDEIIANINKMCEENCIDDIEGSNPEQRKYKGQEDLHLESLEYTNQHIRIMHKISFGMKIIAPIMLHFHSRNFIKVTKEDEIYFKFYKRLFNIFNEATDTDPGVDLYNKLYVTVKNKVYESRRTNMTIFNNYDIYGEDTDLLVHRILMGSFISDAMFKLTFPETWDYTEGKFKENPAGFIKVVIKKQLEVYRKKVYEKDLCEVTNSTSDDGLSTMDKMQMQLEKLDEGIITITDVNIETTMKKIRERLDVEITTDEVQYYMKNMKLDNKLQNNLILAYFADDFGTFRDMQSLTRIDYIILILLIKKQLILENGYEANEFVEAAKLPYILTGNVANKISTRIIRNNKFLAKLESSELYIKLVTQKYRLLEQIQPNFIKSTLSSFINTQFTYCAYEAPELLGTPIEYSEDRIADELLVFLNSI